MTEITGFPNYLIYENGDIQNKKRKIFLKPSINRGYLRVNLYKNGKQKHLLVSRLLALAYIPNPNNYPEVDHIDINTLNNNLSNLRWATREMQNENKGAYSNTGEKYIYLCNRKGRSDYYKISKKNCFREYLNCKKYTLEDAIDCRDYLLAMDSVVEDTE